jgi:hypothetical protein
MDRCIFNELTIWEGDRYGSGAMGLNMSCQFFDEKPCLSLCSDGRPQKGIMVA